MAGSFLLDTNIIIALLKDEKPVAEQTFRADGVFIPFIAMAELSYGARKSAHPDANLARLGDLSDQFEVLFPDFGTIELYGVIRAGLRAVGRPIPEADIWIAALAQQYGLTLVSRDTHFQHVTGLEVQTW